MKKHKKKRERGSEWYTLEEVFKNKKAYKKRLARLKPLASWSYTYDGLTGAEYIQVKGDHSGCQTITLREGLNIDLDNAGQIVGIEILDISASV